MLRIVSPVTAKCGSDKTSRKPPSKLVAAVLVCIFFPETAFAHSSKQAFVLIMPTDLYIAIGISTVAITVVLLGFLSDRSIAEFFDMRASISVRPARIKVTTSLGSAILLVFLVYAGQFGSNDPLSNPLPLFVWTVWWAFLLLLHAVLGNFWSWINPWTGLYTLIRGNARTGGWVQLPAWVAYWPAGMVFFSFSILLLADPSPEDPERLSIFVAGYWFYTFLAMLIFGREDWLERGESFTILFSTVANLSMFKIFDGRMSFGPVGWRLVKAPARSIGFTVVILMILATNSFDGFNETFFWLGSFGINPLEPPGRSSMFWLNVSGLVLAQLSLIFLVAMMVWIGLRIVSETGRFAEAFGRLAYAIVPIAVGYHFAHYLTVLLVNGQYALLAANDPMSSGADLFGLAQFRVSTGFFNTAGTVRVIWSSQSAAVVIGHTVSLLVAHAIASRMFGASRTATLSQVPLFCFMILYTGFGLWLLATPRGG